MKTVKPIPSFTFAARAKSFHYAAQGLLFMLKTQHNAWLHLLATLLVIGGGLYCQVTANDWRWLIVAMVLVWSAEAFNTAVEYVCDVVSPDYSEAVKQAKDIAAGAVLICAFSAVLIGGITFVNYI